MKQAGLFPAKTTRAGGCASAGRTEADAGRGQFVLQERLPPPNRISFNLVDRFLDIEVTLRIGLPRAADPKTRRFVAPCRPAIARILDRFLRRQSSVAAFYREVSSSIGRPFLGYRLP